MGLEASKRTRIAPGVTANKTPRSRTGNAKSAPAQKRGSWTFSLGLWSYSSSTGQHTFKLGKTLKYKSATRTQRAAKKKAKAAAKRLERNRLATYYAQQTATAEMLAQKRENRRPPVQAGRATQQPAPPTQPAPSPFFAQHQQAMRTAGACGAKTADGTGCARRGHCPYHSRG